VFVLWNATGSRERFKVNEGRVLNWTDDEIKTLQTCQYTRTWKEIAELLGRSYDSVSRKANKLGIYKETGNVRRVHSNGYIVVRRDDYPIGLPGFYSRVKSRSKDNRRKSRNIKKNGRYVYEHYINWWLAHPDDPVKPHECIHHIDGDPTNNKPENIQKVLKKDHIMVGRWRHTVMPSKDADFYISASTSTLSDAELNFYIDAEQSLKT
jgi:hypothetical protein